jgi:hypothetical protein
MYPAAGGAPSLLPPLLTTRVIVDAIVRASGTSSSEASVASQSNP